MRFSLTVIALASVFVAVADSAIAQQWKDSSNNNIYNANSGNVGVGLSNPRKPLHLHSTLKAGKTLPLQGTAFRISNGTPSISGTSVHYAWDLRSNGATLLLDHYKNSTIQRTPLRIMGNGNVGMGVSFPEVRLQVSGGSQQDGGVKITTDAADAGLQLSNSGGADYFVYSTGADSPNGAAKLAFGEVGSRADMVLNQYGWVGIGTTDPQSNLHVAGIGSADPEFQAVPAPAVRVTNYASNQNIRMAAKADTAGLFTNTNLELGVDYNNQFWFSVDGVNQMIVKRGAVGILKSKPKAALHVGGRIGLDDVQVWNGTDDNDLTWDGMLIAREGSSQRYKKNIRPLQDDFHHVLRLEAKEFQMREGYGKPDQWLFGYVAEDLEQAGLDRLITRDAEGRPDGVKYKKICVYLTEVVKEHQRAIAELKLQHKRLLAQREREFSRQMAAIQSRTLAIEERLAKLEN